MKSLRTASIFRIAGFASVLWSLCAVSLAVDVPPAVLEAQERRIGLIESVAPSVVCVFGRDGGGGGSGVLISPDGYALTNFHVTSGAGDVMRCGLNDGKLYDAVIVGIDPTGDVALIKLLGRDDFPFSPLGDSDALRVGEWVYVMGNPFLLASDFTPTITYGIVSGLHRYQYPAGTFLEYTDSIQFDTSLNPGNSGGPLFNEKGEVVGINGRGSFEKRGRVNVGAGYAISINQVKHFLDHLKSGRVVDHGTIGANVSTDRDGAVRIASILDTSDAYRRGLRSGDEIVSFAGRPIRSANQFQNVLGIYPSGWMLPLTYRRGAETREILVRLTNAHRESELREFSETPPDREHPQPGKRDDQPEQEEPIEEKDKPQPRPAGGVDPDSLVEKKPGFANYHFNRIEQQRVLESLHRNSSLRGLAKAALVSGITGDGRPFTLTIADPLIGLDLGGRAYLQPLDGADGFIDEPPGSGGLLAGIHLLRQVLAGRTDQIAGFLYYGSEPLDGTGPLVDVLIAEDRGSTLRLYVVRDDGRLAGFDFNRTEGVDDCRVRFGRNAVTGEANTSLPAEWNVRSGDQDVFSLRVEQIGRIRPADSR